MPDDPIKFRCNIGDRSDFIFESRDELFTYLKKSDFSDTVLSDSDYIARVLERYHDIYNNYPNKPIITRDHLIDFLIEIDHITFDS